MSNTVTVSLGQKKPGQEKPGPAARYTAIIEAPLADYPFKLGVRSNEAILHGIDFLDPACRCKAPATVLAQEVVAQLHAYFADPHFQFDLPIAAGGTAFQQRVWQALRGIAAGAPLSYGELARQLDSSPRAVGGACRRNPVPIVVPCHRVVASQGPGGFAGATHGPNMVIKQWLLDHEACA